MEAGDEEEHRMLMVNSDSEMKKNYDYDADADDADDADGADLFEFNITWADGHLARLTDFQCQPCTEWERAHDHDHHEYDGGEC